jgi:hypothetical protein
MVLATHDLQPHVSLNKWLERLVLLSLQVQDIFA